MGPETSDTKGSRDPAWERGLETAPDEASHRKPVLEGRGKGDTSQKRKRNRSQEAYRD